MLRWLFFAEKHSVEEKMGGRKEGKKEERKEGKEESNQKSVLAGVFVKMLK